MIGERGIAVASIPYIQLDVSDYQTGGVTWEVSCPPLHALLSRGPGFKPRHWKKGFRNEFLPEGMVPMHMLTFQ